MEYKDEESFHSNLDFKNTYLIMTHPVLSLLQKTLLRQGYKREFCFTFITLSHLFLSAFMFCCSLFPSFPPPRLDP